MNITDKGLYIEESVLNDNRLRALDKIIYSNIRKFDTAIGCHISQEYIAQLSGCTRESVNKITKKLIKLGYIDEIKIGDRGRVITTNKYPLASI